jgi:hypothetical protein
MEAVGSETLAQLVDAEAHAGRPVRVLVYDSHLPQARRVAEDAGRRHGRVHDAAVRRLLAETDSLHSYLVAVTLSLSTISYYSCNRCAWLRELHLLPLESSVLHHVPILVYIYICHP